LPVISRNHTFGVDPAKRLVVAAKHQFTGFPGITGKQLLKE
jgi:hypothetical protein